METDTQVLNCLNILFSPEDLNLIRDSVVTEYFPLTHTIRLLIKLNPNIKELTLKSNYKENIAITINDNYFTIYGNIQTSDQLMQHFILILNTEDIASNFHFNVND